MFYVYTIQDRIIISPEHIGEDLIEILHKLIKEKYIGKVIPKEGLCVSFENIQVEQSLVYPGEGDLLATVSVI